MSETLALLHFHLGSAVRIALRIASVKLFAVAVAVMLAESPGMVVRQLARGLSTGDVWRFAPWLVALWVAADCHVAATKLAPSLIGWHLHLPVGSVQVRRAFVLALIVVQLPVLGLWLTMWLGTALAGGPVRPIYLISLVVTALGAAYAALPLRRFLVRGLGVAAMLLAGSASAMGLLGATGCLVAAEALAGPLGVRRKSAEPRHRASSTLLHLRIALRSIGLRRMFGAYAGAAVPLAAGWLFVRNNGLEGAEAALGIRAGCGLAVVALLHPVASQLKILRPPWGWSRSLPRSSRRAVLGDAGFLAALCLPVMLFAARVNPAAVPALLAVMGYVALRLTAAIRQQENQLTSLGVGITAEIVICALFVAAKAWGGLALLALWPWGLRICERRERGLKVGLWLERHNAVVGEPAP